MVTDTVKTSTPSGVAVSEMDKYGRTEAERTVVLASQDADAINLEVEAGRHDSYDDALAYVIVRGLAEIRRQRESALKAEQARKAAKGKEQFNNFLRLDPSIVSKPEMLMKLLKECGLTNGASTASK